MPKEKLVEVVRSFSRKLSLPHYENIDIFCSYKEECGSEEVEETSKRAYHFCKFEVERDIEEYKKRNEPKPVETTTEGQKKEEEFKQIIKDNPPSYQRPPEQWQDGKKDE
jgi:hypothetical protein